MSTFINYLDPNTSLWDRLLDAYINLQIPLKRQEELGVMLEVLRIKDQETYKHSIRVGLLARLIGMFMHLDQRALLYAGLLHDMGKAQTNPKTLKKTEGWNEADTAEIQHHVWDGYRLLRGQFDFSAEVILWHHRFQPNSYPAEEEMPVSLHEYSQGTKIMIPLFGRLLALADSFDASHRVNDKFAKGDDSIGGGIKKRMLEHNRDQAFLVQELYEAGIFTTQTFEEVPNGPKFEFTGSSTV